MDCRQSRLNIQGLPGTGFLVILLFLMADSSAHELTTTIGLGLEYSDNIRRVIREEEEADIVVSPTVSVDYLLEYPEFEATLAYTASVVDYRRNNFDGRTDLVGEGRFRWTIVPRRLFWNFYQNINRLAIDSLDVDTPQNQTDRSIVQTGPAFMMNFGRNSYFRLDASWVNSRFDSGRLAESTQNQYRVEYIQGIGSNLQVGITGQYADVEFDNNVLDYTDSRVGFAVRGTTRNTTYSLDIGPDRIDRSGGASTSGFFIVLSASLTRKNSNWEITANRQLTDSSTGLTLAGNLGNNLQNGDIGFDEADVVERTRYEAGWDYELVPGRSTLNINLYFDKRDYQTRNSDQDTLGARLEYRYRFSRRLSAGYRYEWAQDKRALDDFSGEEQSILRRHRITLYYQPNQRLNMTCWISDGRRDFSPTDRDYQEFSAGLTVGYRI